MADIEALCDRAMIINQGHLVYDGKLGEINQLFGRRKLLSVKTARPADTKKLSAYGIVREQNAAGAVLEVFAGAYSGSCHRDSFQSPD